MYYILCMKKIINAVFWIYQIIVKTIFTLMGVRGGRTCRIEPTCSEYARQSFKKYSFFKAFLKTIRRIVKCHPWSSGGIDLP